MQGAATLDFEEVLPLSLELEYLLAVGAGRQEDINRGKPWTITELIGAGALGAGDDVAVVRQRFNAVFDRMEGGQSYIGSLIQALTTGESEGIKERITGARQAWDTSTKVERARAHSRALARYNLPGDRGARAKEFINISRRLKVASQVHELETTKKLDLLGFRDLREKPAQAIGFQRYLEGDNLPYFSRDEYIDEIKNLKNEVSENEIKSIIDSNDSDNIILISGPGGVGKTRLASHISRESSADIALRQVNPYQTDYTQLFNILSKESNIIDHVIIFIDYAENILNAEPLKIFQMHAKSELDIRTSVILCSRAVGAKRVGAIFRDIGTSYEIGANMGRHPLSYEDWLVRRILSFFGLEGHNIVEAVCSGRPVLAAFAGYLSTDHPDAFAKQFDLVKSGHTGAMVTASSDGYAPPLISDEHFRMWMQRRLGTFDSLLGSVGKRRAAEVALALPFYSASDQDRILNEDTGTRRQAFEILEDDRWIDPSGEDYLSVAHDVLADGLVTEHIFGDSSRATQRIRELLQTAIDYEYFNRALIVIDRVVSDENLKSIDALALIGNLADDRGQEIQINALGILRSRLVRPDLIPVLVENVESFSEGLDNDPEAYAELSRVALSLKRRGSNHLVPSKHPRFFNLLRKAGNRAGASTLSNLLEFDPEGNERRGAIFIRRNRLRYEAGFVIQAYLEQDLDPATVAAHVAVWLERFGKQRGASFVLSSWFQVT